MSELLNVDTLVPWDRSENKHGPVEKAFSKQFSLTEVMSSWVSPIGALGSKGEDPHFDARKDIITIGRMVDSGVTRAIINCEDQSEAILVDIVKYKGNSTWCQERTWSAATVEGKTNPKSDSPIIFLRYSHQVKENPNKLHVVSLIQKTMPSSGGAQSIRCASRQEMEILKEFFLANSRKLPDHVRCEIEKNIKDKKLLKIPNSHTSFVSLLLIPEDTEDPKHKCAVCGVPSKAACARCKTTHYCGKKCQKADWKGGHKDVCIPPEKTAKDEAQDSNNNQSSKGATAADEEQPWVDILDQSGLPDLPKDSIPFSFSLLQSGVNNIKIRDHDKSKPLSGVARDTMTIVKVQIQMGSKAEEGKPLMIYPKGKKWEHLATPHNIIGGQKQHARLHNFIYTRGIGIGIPSFGGLKVYLDAYVTQEGKLRIMLSKLHPCPKW